MFSIVFTLKAECVIVCMSMVDICNFLKQVPVFNAGILILCTARVFAQCERGRKLGIAPQELLQALQQLTDEMAKAEIRQTIFMHPNMEANAKKNRQSMYSQ